MSLHVYMSFAPAKDKQCNVLCEAVWGSSGEATEFNLWHRISRRARTALAYIHTTLPTYIAKATLHSYGPPRHTYITVVACYILTLMVTHLTSNGIDVI